MARRCGAALALAVALTPPAADAGEVRVAVAANFTAAAKDIGAAFAAASAHRALFSFGSSGKLYAQIVQRAPFDVFLSADRERPALAVANGLAVAGSRFTYAIGRLALYSRDATLVSGADTLREARFTRLAIANPATAPYGAAALDVLAALGLRERLAARLVRGDSVAQAFQFVETGNAEIGLVALAQIVGRPGGSRWVVPDALHGGVAQDAVLLERGAVSAAARAFVAFLRGPDARALIRRHGYGDGG